MSEQIERRRGWALGAMVCLVALVACNKPSHDNVEKWRNTEEGPGRLEKAVKNTDLDMDVRAHAAEALISLDQVDKVVAAVGTMSPEQRNFFFEKLTPRLWAVA